MAYDYSRAHVARLLKGISDYKLSTPPEMFNTPLAKLTKVYNGIGPGAWSSRFRKLVTRLLEWFEPEALIHDWEYEYAKRSYWAFTAANLRFAYNAAKAAWIEARRSVASRRAKRRMRRRIRAGLLLALLCQLFGWRGFRKNKKRNKNQ